MLKRKNLPEVGKVELKTLFGLRPGLLILFSIILVLIILSFLLFFLPGIIKGGRYVSFSSPMSSVGVFIDGKYTGSNNGSYYFVPSGVHSVKYVKDGITLKEGTIEVDHPIFLTLFRRPVMNVDITSDVENKELKDKVVSTFISELSNASRILEYDSRFPYRPIFEERARDFASLSIEDTGGLWDLASSFITSKEMLEDYKGSVLYLRENGFDVNDYSDEIELLFSSDGAVVGIEDESNIPSFSEEDGYLQVPAGEYVIGRKVDLSYPDVIEESVVKAIGGCRISTRLVTESDYALFLRDNPFWGRDNKSTLIEKNLVDEHYLDGVVISPAFHSQRPIRNISYNAAKAYVEYISEKEGCEYYIPTEGELEVSGISGNSGLWEFSSTPFVPLSRYLGIDTSRHADLLSSVDVVVKGGKDGENTTLGVVPRNMTSEYIGLRIAKR